MKPLHKIDDPKPAVTWLKKLRKRLDKKVNKKATLNHLKFSKFDHDQGDHDPTKGKKGESASEDGEESLAEKLDRILGKDRHKEFEESDVVKQYNEDNDVDFRKDYVVDDDLFDELDLTEEELMELEGAYLDTGYNAGDAILAGVEIDSSMIEDNDFLESVRDKQGNKGYNIHGEGYEAGELTPDGGNFEPDEEPSLDTYMRNHYPTVDGLDSRVGFLMSDGKALDMSHGQGDRADDHRSVIPSEAARKRWGWPEKTFDSRGEALGEILERSRAIRVNVAHELSIDTHVSPSSRQRQAIREYLEFFPSEVYIDTPHGSREIPKGAPASTVLDAIDDFFLTENHLKGTKYDHDQDRHNPNKGFAPGADISERVKRVLALKKEIEESLPKLKLESEKIQDKMQEAYDEYIKHNSVESWDDSEEKKEWAGKYNESWTGYYQQKDKLKTIEKGLMVLPIAHLPTKSEYEGSYFGEDDISYKEAVEKYGSEPAGEMMQSAIDRGHEWDRRVQWEYSMGNITREQAEHIGWHESSGRNFDELPEVLYHVGTAKTLISEQGLKTRDELSQQNGLGLGGGASNTISYTTDPKIAEDIYAAMKEGQAVAAGKITVMDMLEAAREGKGSTAPYEKRFLRMWDGKWESGQPLPRGFQALVDGNHSRWNGLKMIYEITPATVEESREDRFEAFKRWALVRHNSGGHLDPLFFSTDVEGFSKIDPDEIAIVKVKAKPKARGYEVSSLGEWRSFTGDNVEITDIYKTDIDGRLVLHHLKGTKYDHPQESHGNRKANLKKWFGNSQVVDEDGNPLVLYHGTYATFTEFNPSAGLVNGNEFGNGINLTSDPAKASAYATEYGGSIIPVYLKAENVLDISWEGKVTKEQQEIISKMFERDAIKGDYQASSRKIARFPKEEKQKAYDLYDERRDHWEEHGQGYDRFIPKAKRDGDTFIVEYSDTSVTGVSDNGKEAFSQLKNIYGSDYTHYLAAEGIDAIKNGSIYVATSEYQVKSAIGNKGTFDPSDPNILNHKTGHDELTHGNWALKRWFGDSKVVGSSGEPLVVYHGTINTVEDDIFLPARTSELALLGRGSYFTSSAEDAEKYSTTNLTDPTQTTNPDLIGKIDSLASDLGISYREAKVETLRDAHPQVYPVYLRIERPMNIGHEKMTFEKNQFLLAANEIEKGNEAESLYHQFHRIESKDGKSAGQQQFELLRRNGATQIYGRLRTMSPNKYDGIILHEDLSPLSTGKHYVIPNGYQIKSAIGNRGTFDPNDPIITNHPTGHREKDHGNWATGKVTKVDIDTGAESYFGIGHGDFNEELGAYPKFQVWALINGSLEASEVFVADDEDPDYTGDSATHGSLWGHSITDRDYKGRYEPETGTVSVVVPDHKKHSDHEYLLRRIYKEFDNVKDVVILNEVVKPLKIPTENAYDYLESLIDSYIFPTEKWMGSHITAAYKKGIDRGYMDGQGNRLKNITDPKVFEGMRSAFVGNALFSRSREENEQILKNLQVVAIDELKGITTRMKGRIKRHILEGVIERLSPAEVARRISKSVKLSRGKAAMLANDETIRAHSEGVLDSLEAQGITEITLMVEWATAGDMKVCKLCKPLEGIVLKTREAHGMFPRHPNCRCTPEPAPIGEPRDSQVHGKSRIEAAIKKSLKAEGKVKGGRGKRRSPWEGARTRISKKRPRKLRKDVGKRKKKKQTNNFAPSNELSLNHLRGTKYDHDQDTHGRKKVTESEAFKKWFKDSKVLDKNGNPLVMYHGTQKPGRIGVEFRKDRANSGPMQYFTDDPEIASSYAKGKADTSLEFESLAEFVTIDGIPLAEAWRKLSVKERVMLRKNLWKVQETEDRDELFLGTGIKDKKGFDWDVRQARGDHLKAAWETWGNSGQLFNEEERFLEVLEVAGLDKSRLAYDDPYAVRSSLFPVYLSIQNPLVSTDVPKDVITALEKAAEAAPVPSARGYGVDPWDKRRRVPTEWVKQLKEGGVYVWTSIPDFVTEVLVEHGYDGIQDTGGKGGGVPHNVWVPFEPTQIKSATGNKGTFDPDDPIITNHPTGHREEDHGNWARNRRKKSIETLKPFGLILDNPGGDWLEHERQRAEDLKYTSRIPVGSVTASLRDIPFAVDDLLKLHGVMGEHRRMDSELSQHKIEKLAKSIKEEGLQNPPFILVDFRGIARISEGNHRVRAAKEAGLTTIPIELRWLAGGEEKTLTGWSLDDVAEKVRNMTTNHLKGSDKDHDQKNHGLRFGTTVKRKAAVSVVEVPTSSKPLKKGHQDLLDKFKEEIDHSFMLRNGEIYTKSWAYLMALIPEKAAQDAHEGIKYIDFSDNLDQLRMSLILATGPASDDNLPKGIAGAYSSRIKTLFLDGGTESGSHNDLEGAKAFGNDGRVYEIYAHEIVHAMDDDNSVASSPEWIKAYEDELYDGQLTNYAGTTNHEALAEFGRILYTKPEKREGIKQSFPKAFKVFQDKGWVPE